jgi:hypothetical protein
MKNWVKIGARTRKNISTFTNDCDDDDNNDNNKFGGTTYIK